MIPLPRILIIDDEKDITRGFAVFLGKRLACEIVETQGGREALELIDKEMFHVLLLDQHMPGIDGFTILEHVRRKSPQTAVIMVTGLGGAALSHKIERLGGIYMAKPVSLKALQLIVERELERRGITAQHHQPG